MRLVGVILRVGEGWGRGWIYGGDGVCEREWNRSKEGERVFPTADWAVRSA